MVKIVEPKVLLVGATQVFDEQLQEYVNSLGVEDWDTDAPDDPSKLPEFYGRLCYNSFAPGLNPNVTKVREGNEAYLGNIIAQRHGSVLEHVALNFVFSNVSRVFTHELVRHRVGTAMSQESLRYVRLEEIKFWMPDVIAEDAFASQKFREIMEALEALQKELSDYFGLDQPGAKFKRKKEITSAMRRIAPIGLATKIGWSANIRTIRQVLEMRTAPEAEVEIRKVFVQVGDLVKERYPNLFFDFARTEMQDGKISYVPEYSKI